MDNQQMQSLLRWVRAATILLGLLTLSLWISIGMALTKARDVQTDARRQSESVIKSVQQQKSSIARRMLRQTDETLAIFQTYEKRRQSLKSIPANPMAKADLSIRLAQLLGDETQQMMLHVLITQQDLSRALLETGTPSNK